MSVSAGVMAAQFGWSESDKGLLLVRFTFYHFVVTILNKLSSSRRISGVMLVDNYHFRLFVNCMVLNGFSDFGKYDILLLVEFR
jgi:hypothetical protein